jgi:hypothetical protein
MVGYRLVLPENYDPDAFLLEFGIDVFQDIAIKLLANENRILNIKL